MLVPWKAPILGAVGTGASGASFTPSWGASNRSPGSLLVCWAINFSSSQPGSVSTATAGWNGTTVVNALYCGFFWKRAEGGDAAPQIDGSGATILITAMLGEFSLADANPQDQMVGPLNSFASPIAQTGSQADLYPKELVVYASGALYSTAATKTLATTLTNVTTVNSTNNNAVSTVDHYDFGWGITTGNSAADGYSFSFTTTKVSSAGSLIRSFIPGAVAAPQVVGQAGQRSVMRMEASRKNWWRPRLWLPPRPAFSGAYLG